MRNIISFIVIYFSWSFALCDAQSFQWAFVLEGTPEVWALASHIDSPGNVYVGGFFEGTIDVDPGPGELLFESEGTHVNFFFMKIEPNGQLEWAHQLGGEGAGAIISMCTGLGGNVYVTGGTSNGPIDIDPDTLSSLMLQSGAFLAQFSQSGDLNWAFDIPGSRSGNTVLVDDLGNVYIRGRSEQIVDLDPGPQVNLINNGTFLAKYDSLGNFIWGFSLDFANRTLFNHTMALSPSGHIYLAGNHTDSTDFDPGSSAVYLPPGSKSFISKYDSNGNLIWVKDIDTLILEPNSILVDSLGNTYLSGNNRGIYDTTSIAMLVKFSPQGTFLWHLARSTSSSHSILSVASDLNGNLTAVGIDTCYGLFVWRLDTSGTKTSVNCLHGNNSPYLISANSSNEICLAGEIGNFPTDFDMGPGTYQLSGSNSPYNWFIVKYGNQAPTQFAENIPKKALSVFPNPSSGKVSFSLPTSHPLESIYLFDSNGIKIDLQLLSPHSFQMNHLPSGMYTLKMNSNGKVYLGKILLQK